MPFEHIKYRIFGINDFGVWSTIACGVESTDRERASADTRRAVLERVVSKPGRYVVVGNHNLGIYTLDAPPSPQLVAKPITL